MGREVVRTDEEILWMLYLWEQCGCTAREIAINMGLSRNSVIGTLHRVRKCIEAECPPDHHDGTMPALWWQNRQVAA
jgi:hypothetical protein